MIYGKRPVEEEFTSYLGKPKSDCGIFFRTTFGASCFAYRDAYVAEVGKSEELGNYLWLYCDLPKQKNPIRVLHAHLFSIHCKQGDHVKEGQFIGFTTDMNYFEARELPKDKPILVQFYSIDTK